jgi:hypothetical protein
MVHRRIRRKRKMVVKISNLVILAVAFIVTAVMFPIAMQQIVGTATTVTGNSLGIWNSAFVTMWQVLLPVLVIVGIALLYVQSARGD